MESLQDMQRDVATVGETLLAFVAQACPDRESEASRLAAARCLISYAQAEPTEDMLHLPSSHEQPKSDAYPPHIMHSCSALQPLLGQIGVLDTLNVLKALHGRMHRLRASDTAHPNPCAAAGPCDSAQSDVQQGSTSPSDFSAASASQAVAKISFRDVIAEGHSASCVKSPFEGGAVGCSPHRMVQPDADRTHVAHGSSEGMVQRNVHTEALTSLNNERRKQLPVSAAGPLQFATKDEAGERHRKAAQQAGAHVAHKVSALRGEALRQSDTIADLRARLRSTEEEHAAQVDLLTTVHTDQEALIADLSEQLSACRTRCAELEAVLAELCGPSRAAQGVQEGYPTRAAELQAAEGCVAQLTEQLAEAQESLAAHSAVLEEKEASLQECEGQQTHLEAKAAVQHHQQQITIARLEDSNTHLAAKLAVAKDQNTALRIACGELQLLLTVQKAAMAEQECRAACQRTTAPARALPAGTSSALQGSEKTQHMAFSLAPAEVAYRQQAAHNEAVIGEAISLDVDRDAAEREKQVSRLRAALSASERQRERQAALHNQELEALRSRIEQAQKADLAPATPDNGVGRPSQASTDSSSGHIESAHLHQSHGSQPLHRQESLLQMRETQADAPDTPYRLCPSSIPRQHILRESVCRHQEEGLQQTCAGCRQWQRRCAELQQQHEARTAESALSMRAEVVTLRRRLSDAQHEAASVAADLAENQRTCMDMQQQLIMPQPSPPLEKQHAVIPLGEYLNLTGDPSYCTERIQAMSLGSLEASSTDSQSLLMAAQLNTIQSSGRSPVESSSGQPVYKHDARLYSSAASMADSDGSCSSGRVCRGSADVDTVLQALEDVMQRPCTLDPGAVESAPSMSAINTCGKELGGGHNLQTAREGIAAALKRRGELNAELAHLHAEVVASRARLANVQACQSPSEVLKLKQEIRRLKAALPAKSGGQHLRQWELAVEEAAAELHSTEEQLQEAMQQLLGLRARCAEAASELQSQEAAAQEARGEVGCIQKRLEGEQQKLAEVAREVHQQEAAAAAAKGEAKAAALQCQEQSQRHTALLADQQNMGLALREKRKALHAQEAALMQGEQELSRVEAALEGVFAAKGAAEQELQTAQRGAAAAASQAAAAQEALEDAKAGLCKVQAEEASRQESVRCLATDLDRLGREKADASAAHADVSAALLEAKKQLLHFQGQAKEEGRTLQALKKQVAAASCEADASHAQAAQAHRQLAMLQQAVQATQHNMHSTHNLQPGACTGRYANPCQGSTKASADELSEQMTPTRQRFALWHEDRTGLPLDRSPEGNSSRLRDNRIQQQLCTGLPEGISSQGCSPIKLTAGHWQYQPNSGSPDGMRGAEHAQRAGGPTHNREPTLNALHGKLCSAEAEVGRLRAQLQAQHPASSRTALQLSQPSHGEPVTPTYMGDQRMEDSFTASWAQEREKNPFAEKTQHGGAAGRGAIRGPHAELASVSAQVAQQHTLLKQLTSQVLQAQAELAGTGATKEQLRNVRRHLVLLESQLQIHASP